MPRRVYEYQYKGAENDDLLTGLISSHITNFHGKSANIPAFRFLFPRRDENGLIFGFSFPISFPVPTGSLHRGSAQGVMDFFHVGPGERPVDALMGVDIGGELHASKFVFIDGVSRNQYVLPSFGDAFAREVFSVMVQFAVELDAGDFEVSS